VCVEEFVGGMALFNQQKVSYHYHYNKANTL